jgi:trypsin
MLRLVFPVIFILNLFLVNAAFSAPITARIIDGSRVPASSFPNVTPIIQFDETFCTGTLVSRDTVLTAAHCFYGDDNRRSVGDRDVQLQFAGQIFQSSKVFIHPNYSSRSEACVESEFDAALIKFSNPELLSPQIVPATLARAGPTKGQALTLVGFGLEGSGQSGQNNNFPPSGIVNFGYTNIERVSSTYLQWDFDPGESNTASGDSGGPSFANISGVETLVGITCGGTGNAEFGTESLNTRIDKIVSWIDSIAGSSPSLTAPQYVGAQNLQAAVGQNFSFELSFGGSSPDSVQVFGLPQGLILTGNTIAGIPLESGQFTLSISSSNVYGSSNNQIQLSVTSFNPNLSVKSVLLQFDNLRGASDFLILKGKINLPVKFKPKGKKAKVQIGRYAKSCKLDSSGGCGSFDFLQLKGQINKGAFRKSELSFTLQLINAKLFNALSTLGFPETDFATSGETVSLPVEIVLAGISYQTTVTLRFRESDLRWVLKS